MQQPQLPRVPKVLAVGRRPRPVVIIQQVQPQRTLLGRIWRGIAWIVTIGLFLYVALWAWLIVSALRHPGP